MDVFLTIDVETYTGDYDSDVFAGGLGLPYILRVCKERSMPVTFFVEALAATRWGIAPLQRVCETIRQAGQDVQLHLHPTVAALEGFTPTDDAMWRYDTSTQARLMRCGLQVLHDCGVSDVSVFRAGDLGANADTLTAMADVGLWIGSNRDLDTKSSIRSRINDHFPVRNDLSNLDRMLDVPVTSFRSALPALDGEYRHFQITALSLREMKHSILQMQKAGYRAATILTHPGEFFQSTPKGFIAKRKNCHRLEGLLDFLQATPGLNPRLMRDASVGAATLFTPPDISLVLSHSVRRIGMQVLARLIPGL